MPSGSTPPPTAMHGTPAAAARRATPSAVLPNAGLGVDPALAGDDEVGPGERAVEVGRLHHEVDPGTQRERRGTGPAMASSPKPTPPAAPAPGVSRSRRPVRRSSASA